MVTFLLGLLLGGIEVIDPQNAQMMPRMWYVCQIFGGLPTLVVTFIQESDTAPGLGRGADIGQVYAGVAGLLNLLCVMDVLTRSQYKKKPAA
jgi:hypothetical protein